MYNYTVIDDLDHDILYHIYIYIYFFPKSMRMLPAELLVRTAADPQCLCTLIQGIQDIMAQTEELLLTLLSWSVVGLVAET